MYNKMCTQKPARNAIARTEGGERDTGYILDTKHIYPHKTVRMQNTCKSFGNIQGFLWTFKKWYARDISFCITSLMRQEGQADNHVIELRQSHKLILPS